MARLTREEIEAAHDALCAAVALNLDMSKHWCEQKWKQAHMLRDLALQFLSQEAVRDEALEEAARECGLCASRQATKHDQKVRDQTRRDLAAAIRALKREPNASYSELGRDDDAPRRDFEREQYERAEREPNAAAPEDGDIAHAMSMTDDGPAPAAPDVASMVKRRLQAAVEHQLPSTGGRVVCMVFTLTERDALLAKLGQGWIPGWDFIVASLEHERERNHTAAGMFPQTAEEHREFDKAFLEIIEHIRWARDRGMPLPSAPGASDD